MTETLLWRDFEALAPAELYAMLRLRCDVFIVEQDCAYADIDGKDPQALHLLAYVGPDLAGCLRVFAPEAGGSARIGRVVVAPPGRGTGLGRRLMQAALDEIEVRHGTVRSTVELSAQAHLERFYASLGFVRIGADYLEDNIRHCDMRR